MKKSIDELELNNIFKKHYKKNLKYYDADYIIGEIPDDIFQKINDVSTKIDNLKIRGINSYFNSLFDYSVIPCYKEKENKCQENNEFDYEKQDKYNATKYEGSDEDYITYYQIDKFSESQLVYSYVKIEINKIYDYDFVKEYLIYFLFYKLK